MTTRAITGYGFKLQWSTDNVNYATIAQLQRFVPAGSKQTLVDQTNILTPLPFTQPYAARVDSGDWDLAGVLDPQSGFILVLGQLHAGLTQAYFKVLLSDGVTSYGFQAFVSEYVPFEVDVAKFVPFRAKLRVTGGLTGPLGSA